MLLAFPHASGCRSTGFSSPSHPSCFFLCCFMKKTPIISRRRKIKSAFENPGGVDFCPGRTHCFMFFSLTHTTRPTDKSVSACLLACLPACLLAFCRRQGDAGRSGPLPGRHCLGDAVDYRGQRRTLRGGPHLPRDLVSAVRPHLQRDEAGQTLIVGTGAVVAGWWWWWWRWRRVWYLSCYGNLLSRDPLFFRWLNSAHSGLSVKLCVVQATKTAHFFV